MTAEALDFKHLKVRRTPDQSREMVQSYFEHYVLAGGWAMLLLIPASVLAVAIVVRGVIAMRSGNFAESTKGTEPTRTMEVIARLEALSDTHKTVTAEDVRAESWREVIDLYSLLQPLPTIAFLAPLVGLLASTFRVMAAQRQVASAASIEPLAAAVEGALIPMVWGIGVACIAYAGYAALKARLYYCERNLLVPRVEAGATRLIREPALRRSPRTETAGPEA
jgi:hypothetical protein